MKRYDKYKPSKIPWIGNIPCHWYVKKLRFISDVQFSNVDKKIVEGEQEIKLCNYLDVYNNDFIGKDIDFMISTASLEEIQKFRLKAGDVLATKDSEDPNDIGVPALVKDDFEDVICGYHLAQIRPSKTALLGMYLFRLLQSDIIRQHFATQANGITRFGLSVSSFKDLQVLLPSLPEQTVIACYLDKKTTQIDDLITKKQRLIELLKEERAAIINQVVTKGINPHVKMKDLGIEWLGEIPKHWEVKKLKYIIEKIGSGVTPKGGASVYKQEGIPLLRSQNVHFDGLRLDDVAFISEEIHTEMIGSRVLAGDVLLNITGASIGRCCVVPADIKEANVNQHVCILRPAKTIDSHFLCNYLTSEKGQIQIFSSEKGISREGLNYEQTKSFIVPIPPKTEQHEIINYIANENKIFGKTISKIQREIELLQEYRTALISEVVIGKIDVLDEVVA